MTALDVLGIEARALYSHYPDDAVLYVDPFKGVTANRAEARLVPVYGEDGSVSGFCRVRIGRDGSLVEER
jgi:hypothetical protein